MVLFQKFTDLIGKFGLKPYAQQAQHFQDFADGLMIKHQNANDALAAIYNRLDEKSEKGS